MRTDSSQEPLHQENARVQTGATWRPLHRCSLYFIASNPGLTVPSVPAQWLVVASYAGNSVPSCGVTAPFACLSEIEWRFASLCSHGGLYGLCSLCAAGFTADQPLIHTL